jgi:cysteinyl-tRNA synthetase
MAIQLYDSLTRSLRPLKRREEGRVSMYACGPTVYNFVHIGNARTILWFDFIRSYLEYRGYEVTFAMNYTDVDDKIIERSAIERTDAHTVARKYSQAFEEDMAALGVRPPTILLRATEHIDDMVKAIAGLIEKGVAYEAEGDVYFAVESFPEYGKLSGRSLEEMRAGERVEPGPHKRHPLDFALWKSAKEGEPSWPSPWGAGRPGWHIECSVMSTKYLGMGFDIHGGGADLTFPHHENEIAQAEALSGRKPFARTWLHAGLVQMESEKMSKSLGNVVLARDVIKAYSGPVARFWALSGSYRSQVVFSDAALADAKQSYERLENFHQAAAHVLGAEGRSGMSAPRRVVGQEGLGDDEPANHLKRFIAALDDDFNTPAALASLHDLVRAGNRMMERAQRDEREGRAGLVAFAGAFLEATAVLGFDFGSRSGGPPELTGRLIDYLLELREDARRSREFERADAIRDRLSALGVAVEDTPSGPRWRLAGSGGDA